MTDKPIDKLIDVIKLLRDKEKGCAWDIEQNFQTIAKCTLEEAYETVDAIERNDMQDLKEELGDLLLQVVFHAQMADEENLFNFDDVAGIITEKMIRRHPHIFGDVSADTSDQVLQNWEEIKKQERKDKKQDTSILDNLPQAFPSLLRAEKIHKRVVKEGFDWDDQSGMLDKIEEEIEELKAEIKTNHKENIEEEFGDLLFMMTRFGMSLKVSPEEALRKANMKFEKRFRLLEKMIGADNLSMKNMNIDQLNDYWDKVKKQLKAA